MLLLLLHPIYPMSRFYSDSNCYLSWPHQLRSATRIIFMISWSFLVPILCNLSLSYTLYLQKILHSVKKYLFHLFIIFVDWIYLIFVGFVWVYAYRVVCNINQVVCPGTKRFCLYSPNMQWPLVVFEIDVIWDDDRSHQCRSSQTICLVRLVFRQCILSWSQRDGVGDGGNQDCTYLERGSEVKASRLAEIKCEYYWIVPLVLGAITEDPWWGSHSGWSFHMLIFVT